MQVARLALLKTIDRFDSSRRSNFVGSAAPAIPGELKRYVRHSGRAVNVTTDPQERAQAIDHAITRLTHMRARTPTVEEIANHLGLTSEEVLDGHQAMQAYTVGSLDRPRSAESDQNNQLTIQDVIDAEDERHELSEADATLVYAMRRLSERERQILHLRFVGELTPAEIASRVAISQMQVSRLLRKSIAQLRGHTGG